MLRITNFFLPVDGSVVNIVVVSFVVIENSTGNVVVSLVVIGDSNVDDSVVDDADVDGCVDVSLIFVDKLSDVVDRSFSVLSHFFFY